MTLYEQFKRNPATWFTAVAFCAMALALILVLVPSLYARFGALVAFGFGVYCGLLARGAKTPS